MKLCTSLMLILTFSVVFMFSSCGYHSVYGGYHKGDGTLKAEEMLASIKIDGIPNRSGQILRNALIDLLYPKGKKDPSLYKLKISITERKQDLGIKKDQTSSRIVYIITASVALYDIKTGKILKTFSTVAEARVNLVKEQFSVLVAADTGKRRALKQLAARITSRLQLYVSTHPSGKTSD